MPPVALAALARAKPETNFWAHSWLEEVIGRYMPQAMTAEPSEPGGLGSLRAWSVGSVLGNETFVQSRPIVRDKAANLLDDLLRTPAPLTLSAFGGGRAETPRAPQVAVSRFQRWIGVRAESKPLIPELREQLLAKLPDFLQRGASDGSDRELVFLGFLAGLHKSGALGSKYASTEQIRSSLRELEQSLDDGPLNLMVSDGRTLGIIHRGGILLSLSPPMTSGKRGTAQAPANLLLWLPEEPAQAALDAERIAPGVFSLAPARPGTILRD